ncbi:shikimate dehydrogenase [Afifella marina]|uniref:Shikimate dehydrogenase (NADP(+)) n=1 Tax=Afifella marina DSM 2698 TaxID=1120955 RepID=A0A1G5NE00_AFIMA|nr:shikimate dehydrogenase [Afifella marina]MBK1623399.1 shikimate dehydrogenase [Afifella marina DSM 2698]MBK1626393.1 shikimate dehydrogenase [Afifella marina]MBK5917271.1 shikimate dehydrogenase [Afifella marina]RAI18077.1 shikimate dehydrogenase [Afifella marina DSM 2698]SCZ35637.1 shikimate dehydrogenase [Afifella marina DSM 2698]
MLRACVTGWPVSHSRSPLIHGFWLKRYNIEGDYSLRAVPVQEAASFYGGFAASGYVGANVTVPHKEVACAAASICCAAAERLGVANTLWLEDGLLVADNTDGIGFLASLDQVVPAWSEKTECALIVGAGGASRAVIDALVQGGVERIELLNRTEARAREVAERFPGKVRAFGLDALASRLSSADLVINATSAGLAGAELSVPWDGAKDSAIVTDLTYVPLQTPFLRGAASAGLTTVDGLGMLLHQAVPGFERWFGVRPVVDAALRDIVVADLIERDSCS